jgi:hypothetical protein
MFVKDDSKTLITNSGSVGNQNGYWKFLNYFFTKFLPTRGFEITCIDSDGNTITDLNDAGNWYTGLTKIFIKKAINFADLTTGSVHYVIVLYPGSADLYYHYWDGVKATVDENDPDYGYNPTPIYTDTTFPLFNNLYKYIYEFYEAQPQSPDGPLKDTRSIANDGFFIRRIYVDGNGDQYPNSSQCVSWWMPDGGYINQKWEINQPLAATPLPNLMWETYSNVIGGRGFAYLQNRGTIDNNAKTSVTDYVELNMRNSSSQSNYQPWAMWKNIDGWDFYSCASYAYTESGNRMRSVKIGSEYYIDIFQSEDNYGAIMLPVGSTWPGF